MKTSTTKLQIVLTRYAADAVARLAGELDAPKATLIRLMVVRCLTDERWCDDLRDRFLGVRLPFEGAVKKKGRAKR